MAARKNAATTGPALILPPGANRYIYVQATQARGTDRLVFPVMERDDRHALVQRIQQHISPFYTATHTLANSWLSSEVFLGENQRKESGTSLYWKTRANHAENKTRAEKLMIPMDKKRI